MVYHIHFKNFFHFSKNVAYHKQFLQIPFSSPETWTIICNFRNSFPLYKNMDYHMQFLEFLSLFKNYGLSYAISEISFPSPKTCTIICNFWILFPFSKNV